MIAGGSGAVPGAAGLHLVGGVSLLGPGEQARNLAFSTIEARARQVRAFVRDCGEYTWQWSAVMADKWLGDLRAVHHSLHALDTARLSGCGPVDQRVCDGPCLRVAGERERPCLLAFRGAALFKTAYGFGTRRNETRMLMPATSNATRRDGSSVLGAATEPGHRHQRGQSTAFLRSSGRAIAASDDLAAAAPGTRDPGDQRQNLGDPADAPASPGPSSRQDARLPPGPCGTRRRPSRRNLEALRPGRRLQVATDSTFVRGLPLVTPAAHGYRH